MSSTLPHSGTGRRKFLYLSSNQAPASKRQLVAPVVPRISALQLAAMGEFMSGIQDALDVDT
ncbi:hypothetical protein N7465_007544 [Penicillium sp. CMV-2018d]|nr:hypothetical protein N7465_007544 [Penicillium sp. CMV-2018d]